MKSETFENFLKKEEKIKPVSMLGLAHLGDN